MQWVTVLRCVLMCLLDLKWWKCLAWAQSAAWVLEDRRHTSQGSTPPGSPVALLASLGYLSADGDGVDEPELEQNNSRLQALLNRNEYDICTREPGSLLFCTVPELSSIRLAVTEKGLYAQSLYPYTSKKAQ